MSLNTESLEEETSKLSMVKWRCRRGMLELDILLNQFVEQEYEALGKDQRIVLDVLLDYPDQVLFDLLLEKMQASDKAISELVRVIRKSAL